MDMKEVFIAAGTKADNAFRTTCFDSTVEDSMKKIQDTAESSEPIHASLNDKYRNELSAVGTADKVQSFTNYGFSNDTLNWFLWLSLYNDSWVFRRAIDKPAQDTVNAGFVLHGDADYSKVYKAFDKCKADLTQLLMWGALFGGAIAVMMFDTISDEEMAEPMKKDKIRGSRMKLYVTDRWYGVSDITNETVTNMADIDFGKPKKYNVTFADGKNLTIDHSYVLRYEHRTAPKLIKNGQLQGWGYAEGSHILNELSRDDQLKAAITSLVNKCNIEIIKMSGMRGVFMGTDKQNEEQLQKRLEMVNWGRTYNSLTFLDKDDEYNHFEFAGLAGLSQLMEANMWQVAAALEMQGILFGELKGGLSEHSDAMKHYAKTIMARADAYFRPVLTKFLLVQFIRYEIDEDVDFDFVSLDKDTDNKTKMDAMQLYSSVLSKLSSDGVISKYQYAMSIKEFVNSGNITIAFSDEALEKLKAEEQIAILETYKKIGKEPILESQFGKEGNKPMGNESPFSQELVESADFGSEEPPQESSLSPSNAEPISKSDLGEESGNDEVPEES